MVFVTLVLILKGRKWYKGTLESWLVPFAQDGEELIRKIEHLEVRAAVQNERQRAENIEDVHSDDTTEDESDSVLGNDIVQVESDSVELQEIRVKSPT